MTVTRVAAIDCGTNSIRLLVADVDPDEGTLVELNRQMEIVRLGEGVDETGRLSTAALERTFAACDFYAETIRGLGAERTRFVATSASRDATNRGTFVSGVRRRLGVEPEVVPGTEEAALSFAGATRELLGTPAGAEAPYLVVDIGGGSTEFVVGTDRPDAALSVDIGCVRMTERHLVSNPPHDREIVDAIHDIDLAIERAGKAVPFESARSLIGLAGSVTTVAAIALGLPEYDSARIHHSRIPAADVHRIARELLEMDRAQRAALPVMHPGRVDVIGAGALVLSRIVERVGLPEVVVSEHDILDGIAWSQVTELTS